MSPDTTPDVDYAGKVRATDPDTSWLAASLQSRSKTEQLQDHLYEILLTSGPMNDDALFHKYEKLRDLQPRRFRDTTKTAVRTRRKELQRAGRVEDNKTKAPSDAGGPSTVWRAIP